MVKKKEAVAFCSAFADFADFELWLKSYDDP